MEQSGQLRGRVSKLPALHNEYRIVEVYPIFSGNATNVITFVRIEKDICTSMFNICLCSYTDDKCGFQWPSHISCSKEPVSVKY